MKKATEMNKYYEKTDTIFVLVSNNVLLLPIQTALSNCGLNVFSYSLQR